MTRSLAFAFAAAAVFAVPALAQQQLQPGEVPARMRLGVGFSTATATPSFRIPLLVPLAATAGVRARRAVPVALSARPGHEPGAER